MASRNTQCRGISARRLMREQYAISDTSPEKVQGRLGQPDIGLGRLHHVFPMSDAHTANLKSHVSQPTRKITQDQCLVGKAIEVIQQAI